MTDYFLKAETEAALRASLEGAGILDADGMVRDGYALDIIGVIHKPTGVMLQGDEGEYPETAPIAGWHANLRGTLTEKQIAALSLIDAPANPARVWA